jgi:LPS-assembly lipoprotein
MSDWERRPRARTLWPVVTLVVLASLAGCGFRLQGRVPLSSALTITHVAADDVQSDFVQDLRRALLASGVRLSSARADSTAVIEVQRDELLERVISISARNIPREYELTYTVRIRVLHGEREVLPAEEISLSRDFSFDERAVLAKEREKEILRAALARDLVGIVMRRLSSL